jgi:GMP synthase (glutamine-hydrolysing)
MRELLVLEHTAAAGVSAFSEVLDARTSIAPWRRVDVPGGEPLPDDPDELAGVLVMGGTMSAVDPSRYDWMPAEVALLERAVASDVPVLGVCLGAHLLGAALGGEVQRREVPEMAYLELTRTANGLTDEVIAGWPDGAAMLLLHEDEVTTLPAGSEPLLEGSDGTAAWRSGSALAVQFHPEATAPQVRDWVDSGLLGDMIRRAGVDPAALVDDADRKQRLSVPVGRALIGRWIDGPIRLRVT